MKEVLAHIKMKKQEFAKSEIFEFLQDKSIPPRQRLAFAPCLAPFVMGFGELNEHFLRDEPTNDPIKALVNQHTHEDDDHWFWFLEDLKKLGFDMPSNLTDTLRFLWSQELKVSRQTFYEIYRCSYKAIPVHQLAIIEALEATANIFLEKTGVTVEELEIGSNLKFRYFGMHHITMDSSHTIHTSKNAEYISNLQLEKDVEKEAFDLVDNIFELFSNLANSLLDYAKRYEFENMLNNDFDKARIRKSQEDSMLKAS